MRAGRLDNRVHLQTQSQVRDGRGGFTNAWTTVTTRWCAFDQLAGKETRVHGARYEEVTGKITLRYSTDLVGLDTTWRAVDAHTGEIWDIKGVTRPNRGMRRNRDIELMVLEGESDDE